MAENEEQTSQPKPGSQVEDHGCPTPTAHRRLEEAHRWWHGCLDEYDSPEGFRTNLNACVQALRNVTFVLQKEKSLITDFDEWYQPWQERMKNDDVMRWVVKSRNRIVKMGDLELKSTAVARLIATYFDTVPKLPDQGGNSEGVLDKKISLPPWTTLKGYSERIKMLGIPPSILEGAVLSVERRWVDKALPDWELLAGLAYAYGVLADLINDAHARQGVEHGLTMRTPHGLVRLDKREHANGRLPCMITTEESRTASYRIKDGSLTRGGLSFPLWDIPKVVEDRAARKYKLDRIKVPQEKVNSITDMVPFYAEIAKTILKKDKYHGWYIFYFRGLAPCGAEMLFARDRGDKMLLAKQIADSVTINEFDGIIITGEMWMAPMSHNSDGTIIPPAQSPDRSEALIVYAENARGEQREHLITFRRRLGKIILGETIEQIDSEGKYNFMLPTRAIWKRWNSGSQAGGNEG